VAAPYWPKKRLFMNWKTTDCKLDSPFNKERIKRKKRETTSRFILSRFPPTNPRVGKKFQRSQVEQPQLVVSRELEALKW
jgi:hypothetical protein